MAAGRATDRAGYAQLTEQLARQALAVAADAAPHRAREGEMRWPMADALPAARVLIGSDQNADRQALAGAAQSLQDTVGDPHGKVTDGFGHTRPVYELFALHLVGTAARIAGEETALATFFETVGSIRDGLADSERYVRYPAWYSLLAGEHDDSYGVDPFSAPDLSPQDAVPLSPLGPGELIDAWTYNELTELHALHLVATLLSDTQLVAPRVRAATRYHLGHTQPDYTTYQPWALAAFADDPHTAVFAEQQLHDVATHLSIEGPGSAVLPALLLADAAAAMSGKTARAWQRGPSQARPRRRGRVE